MEKLQAHADLDARKLVKTLLRLKKKTLAEVATECGYEEGSLSMVFTRPWPKAEEKLAAALGAQADQIWPHRYEDGKPNRLRGRPQKKTGPELRATVISLLEHTEAMALEVERNRALLRGLARQLDAAA